VAQAAFGERRIGRAEDVCRGSERKDQEQRRHGKSSSGLNGDKRRDLCHPDKEAFGRGQWPRGYGAVGLQEALAQGIAICRGRGSLASKAVCIGAQRGQCRGEAQLVGAAAAACAQVGLERRCICGRESCIDF